VISEPGKVKSIGILAKSEADYVVISTSMSQDGDFLDAISIPMGAITLLKVVEELVFK